MILFEEADDALALILAHELAHHYQGHKAPQRFASALEPASEKEEGEADHYGIKYCILAGYSVHDIYSEILNQVYAEYRLPDKIDGYPSKKVRLEINQEQVEFLAPFAYLFNAAKFVFIHQDYRAAGIMYEELIDKYPGKEVYVNLGTCYALLALSEIRDPVSIYDYSFEIAPLSRLDNLSSQLKRGETTEKQRVVEWLNQAERAFREALKRAPDFHEATISLANIYILRENPERALGLLKSLPQKQFKKNYAFQTALGISYYFQKQYGAAKIAFQAAAKLDPHRGEYNLALFTKTQEEGLVDMILTRIHDYWDSLWAEKPTPEKM